MKNKTKKFPWPCKYLVVDGRKALCIVYDNKECPKRQDRNIISKTCWDYK